MSRYGKERVIGSGAFGSVWLVKSRLTRHSYVMKEVNLAPMSDVQRQRSYTEVAVLAKCNHKNIILYKDALVDEVRKVLCIIMEYADGGDLRSAIIKQNKIPFSEHTVISWLVQICLALQYIHYKKILHRDLKCQNIFLTRDNVIKIGDFGISRILHTEELATTVIGTPYYVSPEICQRKPYSYKSDMWSLGCVLFELATLDIAFKAHSFVELASLILSKHKPQFPRESCPIVQDLVDKLLSFDPRGRPSTDEVLGLVWLQPYLEEYMSMDIRRNGIFECNSRRYSTKSIEGAITGSPLRRTEFPGVNQKSRTEVTPKLEPVRNRASHVGVAAPSDRACQSSKQVFHSLSHVIPSASIRRPSKLNRADTPPKLTSFTDSTEESQKRTLNETFTIPRMTKGMKDDILSYVILADPPYLDAAEYSGDQVYVPQTLLEKSFGRKRIEASVEIPPRLNKEASFNKSDITKPYKEPFGDAERSGKDKYVETSRIKSGKVNSSNVVNENISKRNYRTNLGSCRHTSNSTANKTLNNLEPETPLNKTPPYPDPRYSPYKAFSYEDEGEYNDEYNDEESDDNGMYSKNLFLHPNFQASSLSTSQTNEATFQTHELKTFPSKQSELNEATQIVGNCDKTTLKEASVFDAGYQSDFDGTKTSDQVPFTQSAFQTSPKGANSRTVSCQTPNIDHVSNNSNAGKSEYFSYGDSGCSCHQSECVHCQLFLINTLWKNRIRSPVTIGSLNEHLNSKYILLSVFKDKFGLVYDLMYKDWDQPCFTKDNLSSVLKDSLNREQMQNLPRMIQCVQFDVLQESMKFAKKM